MALLVMFLAALSVYAVIVAAFGESGRQRDAVRKRVNALSGDMQRKFVLDDELNQPLLERFVKPILNSAAATLSRYAPKRPDADAANKKKSQQEEALRNTLTKAGLTLSVANYKLLRSLIMLAAGGAGFVTGLTMRLGTDVSLLLLVGGPLVAYVVVRYVTAAMGTGRQRKLESELPDVLDILSISVEAGLGFEQALNHVTQNMTGPMVDEFSVTCREMAMGRTRREALQALAKRCDFADMHTFTGAVIQAGQLGISIKNVLRAQSVAMRQSRRSRAQEKAQKISTKILLPMVAFIFPVLFIVLLGPAVVNIIGTLG